MNTQLKSQWKEICDEYLQEFCDRHEYDIADAFWVGNDAGGIVGICDMYIDMDNIRYDVDNQVPIDKFEKWYTANLDLAMLQINGCPTYPNYCMGAPMPYTGEQIQELYELQAELDVAERGYNDAYKKFSDKLGETETKIDNDNF